MYASAPYGYVVPKSEIGLANAIASALRGLHANGGYLAALTPWGVEAGAVSTFEVNPTNVPAS